MKSFTPSKYQEDIFNFILNDHRNLVISAVAGSGKTTTLIKALEIIPEDKSVIFLAFNHSIVKELKERVPKDKKNITLSTIHSYGMKTLMNSLHSEVDVKKYRNILQSIIDFKTGKNITNLKLYDFNEEQKEYVNEIYKLIPNVFEKKDFITNTLELCDLCRLNLVNFNIKSIGILEIKKIATKYSIDDDDNESTVAWFLSKIGIQYHKKIDYNDMILLPIILDIKVDTYDFVFIDESQDLNKCQRTLMLKSINNNGGRFISVGDEKQAIYAFAGADHESYQKLKTLPNTVELPLSYTYRVSPEIIDLVKHINPLIIAHPKNRRGRIYDDFSYKDLKDGDMVLCRNTFPLVSLCLKLLTEGKKSFVVGSDIGGSLINLVKSITKKNELADMDDVITQLVSEKDKMVKNVMTKHNISRGEALKERKIVLFSEKIEQLDVLSYNICDPNLVIERIGNIFTNDEKNGIKLSTIHKSKGLESERVFMIHRDLMYSIRCKQSWEIEQERNLEYVAYTRAKTTFGFINDFDAFKTHTKRKIKNKTSNHVGILNGTRFFELTVTNIKKYNGKYGDTVITELIDNDGNHFSIFKEIDTSFLKSRGKNDKVKIGSVVQFRATIKEHNEFNGVKNTKITNIKHY